MELLKKEGEIQEVGAGFFIHSHLLPLNMDGFTNKAIIIKPSTFEAMGVELIKPLLDLTFPGMICPGDA